MPPLKDLIGKRFNRLIVIKRVKNRGNLTCWLCKCDCGNEVEVIGSNLKRGTTKSCGCYNHDVLVKRNTKHNLAYTRINNTWQNMKQRCYNKTRKEYKDYGGRGIKVCDEWKNDFMAFYNWSILNGYDENAKRCECSLDRIDVNGNYEPSNCRWTNDYVQANNRRNNVRITYNGETHTINEWSRITGLYRKCIAYRLRHNWSIEEIFTIPVGGKHG